MSFGTIKTEKGDMRIEFFDNDAPKTVENFQKLAYVLALKQAILGK